MTATEYDIQAALEMLTAFSSVGSRAFDVTVTDLHGAKIGFRSNVPLEQLRRVVGEKLSAGVRAQHNFIIRPRPDLLQLDDLDCAKVQRIGPHSFMVIETSPGCFQAWLALRDIPKDKTTADDLLRRLRKGAGADRSASGATRIAGSLNFKPKYEPNFPRVELRQVAHGRTTTLVELTNAGIMVGSDSGTPASLSLSRSYVSRGRRLAWPSYQMLIDKGRPSKSRPGKTQRSPADFTWCRTAIEWGWSEADTARQLLIVSEKARENGEAYAKQTARRAALSVQRGPYHG